MPSLSLPTFATAQFKRFFDCGRAVRCMVPLGLGRFMHLVVLYGFQGADADAEQLALTEQLFDAALGGLSVVARGQPCTIPRRRYESSCMVTTSRLLGRSQN